MTRVQPDSGLLEYVYEPVLHRLQRAMDMVSELGSQEPAILSELLEHVLDSTGKLIRPSIVLLASNFHSNDVDGAETMAAAVELLHIATLIHDDTVDGSDVRRGKPTVSSAWGTQRAVLLGDYVFASSATLVCDTGNLRVIRRFAETAVELSSGEFREIDSAYSQDLAMDRYLDRIYRKTASLFSIAAESGAILAGSLEPLSMSLKDYGFNLGMAFQIVDDVLDFDATLEEVGKPVGNDLSHGILTLPAILAIERYPEDNPVLALCEDPSDHKNLERAIDMVQNSSLLDESLAVARQYSLKAINSLGDIEKNRSRESLEALAEYVLNRRG